MFMVWELQYSEVQDVCKEFWQEKDHWNHELWVVIYFLISQLLMHMLGEFGAVIDNAFKVVLLASEKVED